MSTPPPVQPRRDGLTPTAWWGLAIGAAAVLMIPLFVVDIPPILDYPNHLARLAVLAAGPDDPILGQFYQPQWAIIPNLALDLIGPPLLRWFDLYDAGRIILAAVLLMSMTGVIFYNWALFGRWLAWPIGSALIAYNGLFLLGFINFLIALGLAFLMGAFWTVRRDKHPVQTSLLCAGGTVVIFFCHLFGVLFLGILIASHEAERFVRNRPNNGGIRTILHSAVLVALVFIPAVVLLRFSAFNKAISPIYWQSLPHKIAGLFNALLNYNGWLDVASCLLLLAFVAACTGARRWRMPLSSRVAMATLLAVFVAVPFIAKGGAWIDVRFSLAAAFLLFAGCSPQLSRRAGAATGLAFIA